MTKEAMQQTRKQEKHKKITKLMCLEVEHNNQVLPPLPCFLAKIPSTEETPHLVQEENVVITAKYVKQMIEEVPKDQSYCKTPSSKQQQKGDKNAKL